MALLNDDDKALVTYLLGQSRKLDRLYTKLDGYYEGEQRLERIGMAVPPELAMFKAAVNVPRLAVDEVVARQNLKGFQRSGGTSRGRGADGIDRRLREAWEYNNLDSLSTLCHQDARTFGRGFVSVSTNPDDKSMPLITVESPRSLAVDVSPRGDLRAALRTYRDDRTRERLATLYKPNVTRWLAMGRNGWEDASEPDEHGLGVVSLVMFLNRARTGAWTGVSEMADVLEKTDAIARLISNMQIGGEAMAWPKRWAAGVKKEDFVDKNGKPIPAWEAYMTAIMTAVSPEAKFGSYAAADLANFHKAVDALLSWCAAELGLPLRFMGQQTVNPASEGAIKADESRLIRNTEKKNRSDGDSWSWTMGLWDYFRTGKKPAGNSIRALWFNPATPTESQLGDYVLKLRSQGILSREGAWDEMGWDEPRKDRERAYFATEEAADPMLGLVRPLVSDAAAASNG